MWKICIAALMAVTVSLTTGLPLRAELSPGHELAAQNELLKLFIDQQTASIAVQCVESDTLWLSSGSQPRANEQFSISYFDPQDTPKRMYSSQHSVDLGQFVISAIPNGVRIDYLLGEKWRDEDFLPVMISQQRFEEVVLSGIDNQREREFLRSQYTLIKLEKATEDYTRLEIPLVKKEQLFGDYTLVSLDDDLTDRAREALIRHLVNTFRANRRDISNLDQITLEHLSVLRETPTLLLNDRIMPWDREDMIELLHSSGYTPLDKQVDAAQYHLDAPEQRVEWFEVPVEYRLDEDSLVVRVPTEEVVYPKDVFTYEQWGVRGVHDWLREKIVQDTFDRVGGDTVTFPIHTIRLLPYFGAPEQNVHGYLFVPDGAGALINLYADRERQTSDLTLVQPVYGADIALSNFEANASDVHVANLQPWHLPVFGMKKDDSAFFAIIEKGDAMAQIVAETAGRVNPYDSVSAQFTLLPKGELGLAASPRGGGGEAMNIYQERTFLGDIQIRYFFLDGDDANYVGMAHLYQDYLVKKHRLNRTTAEDEAPFYLNVLGGIHTERPILGFPRQVVEPITMYREVPTIVEALHLKGIDNIRLRYSGWLWGGLEHFYPRGVTLERRLGTEQEFAELQDYLRAQAIAFFPDVRLITVTRRTTGDGFRTSFSSYSLNKQLALFPLAADTLAYVLSPSRLSALVDAFLADTMQLGLERLALRDMGLRLGSDFREELDLLIDRQQAKGLMEDEMKRMIQHDLELMVDGANAYALPYAQHIMNIPMQSSGFLMADSCVPFFPIVLRGIWSFTGEPINLAPDPRHAFLKTIETGGSLYYSGGLANSGIMKDTDFHHFFSIDYKDWLDDAAEQYQALKDLRLPASGERIVAHEQIAGRVFQTTFSGGTKVLVNYERHPVAVDGVMVPARGYRVL